MAVNRDTYVQTQSVYRILMATTLCKVITCVRTHHANGYCDLHNRRRAEGKPLEVVYAIRVCAHVFCGQTFTTDSTNHKRYCSPICKDRANGIRKRLRRKQTPCSVSWCNRGQSSGGYCQSFCLLPFLCPLNFLPFFMALLLLVN